MQYQENLRIDSLIRRAAYRLLGGKDFYCADPFVIQKLPQVSMRILYKDTQVMQMRGGLVIRWKHNDTWQWAKDLLALSRAKWLTSLR